MKKRVIIMGAAGRDFHNFNVCFRDNAEVEVVAFTAAQIPFIERRRYPPELAGPMYPDGIPIYPEEELAGLIKKELVDTVVFSYSDVSHEYVMHRASLCTSLDADFVLLGAEKTMLHSNRPVVTVSAVRTGCGKSGVTRFIAKVIQARGKKPVAIRHPMPYGKLLKERVQRFASFDDMKEADCTIEEMEEYEPLIEAGVTVYSGVDFREILKAAEEEAGIIIWDGGNNDLPFIFPDLEIVVADPLRPGDELRYHPGEANLRRADCVVVNKAASAKESGLKTVLENIRKVNPEAAVIQTASGAGTAAAREGLAHPVDVRPFAVGSIKETLKKYPRLRRLLPAVGYSPGQIKELEETVNATRCDLVLIATPVDLTRVMRINKPAVRVRYEIEDLEEPGLKGLIRDFIKRVD
jgi:predicted GTPase